MEPENEIKIERHDNIAVIQVRGDITAQSEPHINGSYRELNEQEPPQAILIQFEEDAYINSGGIAVLIQILAQTQKKGQQVGITGLSEHFKKIFRMVGITKFADIYDSLDAGFQAMSTDSP